MRSLSCGATRTTSSAWVTALPTQSTVSVCRCYCSPSTAEKEENNSYRCTIKPRYNYGLCTISLAIQELEIQSSKVELSNALCSISLAIPELEIQSSKIKLSNNGDTKLSTPVGCVPPGCYATRHTYTLTVSQICLREVAVESRLKSLLSSPPICMKKLNFCSTSKTFFSASKFSARTADPVTNDCYNKSLSNFYIIYTSVVYAAGRGRIKLTRVIFFVLLQERTYCEVLRKVRNCNDRDTECTSLQNKVPVIITKLNELYAWLKLPAAARRME